MSNIFLTIPVPTANGPGAPVDVSSMGFLKLFSLTGVFQATINIEVSNDGVSWATLTSLTAPNDIKKSFSAKFVRANVAGYVAGAAVLAVGGEFQSGFGFLSLPVPAADGTGASVDVSTLGENMTFIYSGGMLASVTVQISQDGVTYTDAASFSGPVPALINVCGAIQRMQVVVAGYAGGAATISSGAIPSGSGSGGGSGIVWDQVGGTGDATTWADVMAFVNASVAPITIYVKSNGTVPAGVYDLKGSGFSAYPIISNLLVDMVDGAVIQNLGFIEGQMFVRANSTALTPLVFNLSVGGAPNTLQLIFNGSLENAGTVPMIEVAAGTFLVIAILFNGTLLPTSAPIVNALGGAGTTVLVGVFGSSAISNNWLIGGVGVTLLYQNLGGAPSPLPTNAGFAGTTIQNLLTGASCTGVATRPVNPFGALPVGASVFDQSLGITGLPIWWDGTQWVDATGAPA